MKNLGMMTVMLALVMVLGSIGKSPNCLSTKEGRELRNVPISSVEIKASCVSLTTPMECRSLPAAAVESTGSLPNVRVPVILETNEEESMQGEVIVVESNIQ